MDYGKILTRAWEIIWKHKILWLFGFLAGCGTASGGGSGGGNSGWRTSGDDAPPQMQEFMWNMDRFFESIQAWQIILIVTGVILLVIALFFLANALQSIGRIGLIQGASRAEAGAEKLTFSELFNSGKPFFWRIFWLNILFGIITGLIILTLLLPLFGITFLTFGIGLLCLLPFLCLLVPIGWLLYIILEQANIAIVRENIGIIAGVQRGFQVFRDNVGNMILMGLVLGVGGFIAGVVIALPAILIIAPIVLAVIAGAATQTGWVIGTGGVIGIVIFLIYLPFAIIAGSILQAYIKTAWALTYMRLTTAPAPYAPAPFSPETFDAEA